MKRLLLALSFLFAAGFVLAAGDGVYDSGGGGGGTSSSGGAAGVGTITAGSAGQISKYTAATTLGPTNFTENSDGSFGLGGSTYSAISTTFAFIEINVSSPSTKTAVRFSSKTAIGEMYIMTSDTQTSVLAGVSQADNSELIVPLLANSTYTFHMDIVFQTAAATTGLAVTYDCPTDSTTTAQVRLHTAADGTAGEWQGTIHTPLETVIGAGVETASLNQFGTMDGWISTISAGNWTFKFTTEVNGSVAKVKAGTMVVFTRRPF